MKTENLVIFSILMENFNGILGKSPDYIQEKFQLCKKLDEKQLVRILDDFNKDKFLKWKSKWRKLIDLEIL